MICFISNKEVFKGDEINCNKCYAFLNFGCAGFRELVHRNMKNVSEESWSCSKCRSNIGTNKPKSSSFLDTTIENLVESVEFYEWVI
jgi:hypothetical protein